MPHKGLIAEAARDAPSVIPESVQGYCAKSILRPTFRTLFALILLPGPGRLFLWVETQSRTV
jgi:hypothetical protein